MTDLLIKKRLGIALVILGGFAAFWAVFVLFLPVMPLLLDRATYRSITEHSKPLFPGVLYLSLASSAVAVCILFFGLMNRSWKILSNKLWLLGLAEILFVAFVIAVVVVAAEYLPHQG